MESFREIFEATQNENIAKEVSKRIRRFFSSGDELFIAPYLNNVSLSDKVEYKDYKIFVDRDEAVMWYNKDGVRDSLSIPNKLVNKAEILLKKYKGKMQFEEDPASGKKYYQFITGVGKPSDIKDFVKEKLKGVDYSTIEWNK